MQNACSISQSLNFPVSGNYTVSFGAAGRLWASPSSSVGTIQVELDGATEARRSVPQMTPGTRLIAP